MTMTVTPIKISDSEWEVMRVIWTQESTTAQEIIDILGQTMDWKPATIKTLLGRLVKKEAVRTEQAGKNTFIIRQSVKAKRSKVRRKICFLIFVRNESAKQSLS